MSNVLVAKYFLTNKTALRLYVAPNFVSTSEASDYDSPIDIAKLSDADADMQPEDVKSISDIENNSAYDVVIGAGYEMRRGNGRLQGVFGGGAFLGFAGASSSTAYGWAFNDEASEYNIILNGS
jgi:hypothetical protein